MSPGGASLGSDAACTSVRVRVCGLLCWPEREEGLRRYLFQAGQEKNLRAPFLMMLELRGWRQHSWKACGMK